MFIKKSSIVAITLFFLTITTLSGCATIPRVPPSQLWAAWDSQLPKGFKVQIELAMLAENAYHTITDTPIKELQTESGSQRVGDLVTAVRDKYRQWQSYGDYYITFPDKSLCYYIGQYNFNNHGFRAKFGDSVTYESGTPGFGGSVLEAVMDFGNSKRMAPTGGAITSSRGRVIFTGSRGDERNWRPIGPFKDIMEGDRIADIPALIGRIKR